jgi:hypothetical protein
MQEDSCENDINIEDEGSSPLREHNRKGRKQTNIQVESESRQQRSQEGAPSGTKKGRQSISKPKMVPKERRTLNLRNKAIKK